jgi:hypothetical protein
MFDARGRCCVCGSPSNLGWFKGKLKERDWVEESMEAALQEGWISEKKKISIIKQARKVVQPHPNRKETVCLVFGEGAGGATEGLKMVYDRVYSIDVTTRSLGQGRKTTPDFLMDWQLARDFKGIGNVHPAGAVGYLCRKSGMRVDELKAIWGSPNCDEEVPAQALNKGKPWGKGYYAGVPRSEQAQGSLDTLREGIMKALERDPRIQFTIENPAWSAIQFDHDIAVNFQESVVVNGCAYGRLDQKPYRLWMSPAAARMFTFDMIESTDPESLCEACKSGKPHAQIGIPAQGTRRQRTSEEGYCKAAARMRVPWRLALAVGKTMLKAYEEVDQGTN